MFRKKIMSLFAMLAVAFANISHAQTTVYNENIGVRLDNFGGIRILSADGIAQNDRVSLLFGSANSGVFDYLKDASNVFAAAVVDTPSPQFSNQEISVVIDNAYSNAAPDVETKINVYLWNDGGYALARIRTVNKQADTLQAIPGLEILPKVGGVFGNEITNSDASSGIVTTFRDGAPLVSGYQLLSALPQSIVAFDWFFNYNQSDDSLRKWLTADTIFAADTAGTSGSVVVLGADVVPLSPGDSLDMFVGLAIGSDISAMQSELAKAAQKYNSLFVGIPPVAQGIPENFEISQNYPNPFNPETRIPFQIPARSRVSLSVFNILGQKVATLLNETLDAGSYEIPFNGSNLPSGVYFVTIQAGEFRTAKKMVLMK